EITINPALVQHLSAEYDLEVPVDEWVDATGGSQCFDPVLALDRLRDLGQSVPELRINQRLIISTFANIATPFSTDHLPTQHPVLRALAGDEEVRAALGGPSYVPQPTAAEEADEDDAHAQPTVPITDEPLSASTPDSGARDTAEPVVGDTAESVARDTAEIETEADDTAEPATDAETAEAKAADAKADAKSKTPADADAKTEAPAEADEKSEPSVAADGTAAPDTAAGAGSTADVESADAGDDAEDEDVVPAALQEPITPLPDRKPQEEFLVIDVDGDQQ